VENEELKEWKPRHPRLAAIGEYLNRVRDASTLGSLIVGDKGKLLEAIAYKEPLTTGKGETLHGKAALLEGADLIPGGGAVGAIGPLGMRYLGDSKLYARAKDLAAMLRKTKPTDWQLQKEMIEATPGFFPIPRGRDWEPALPHAKFGYEMPEGALAKPWSELGLAVNSNTPWMASLGETYAHPRLEKAYPGLKDYWVRYDPRANPGSGYISVGKKEIGLGPQASEKELLGTLNHEVSGHYVQSMEGWPSGTNSTWARKQLEEIPVDEIEAGAIVPKELARQSDLALKLRKAALRPQSGLSKFVLGDVQEEIAHTAYSRESGEQMANALSRSAAEGGGKVRNHYTTGFNRMYDEKALQRAIDEYWQGAVRKELESTIAK